MWYCGNGFPKDLVPDCHSQSIAQDALRPDLWRCHLLRNCHLMNAHIPAVSLAAQSNTDAQPVVTRQQSEMYCAKYISKHHKNLGAKSALYEVIDSMAEKDSAAKKMHGMGDFEPRKLGGKLHKAFMAEIGEEMCQLEVAHHANGCPEYFCNRPEKNVHLYKKALGISIAKRKRKVDEAEGNGNWLDEDTQEAIPSEKRKLVTKPSDLELYERRMDYDFSHGAPLSQYLAPQSSPREQLRAASLFEFFRLVKFHGGLQPHFSWHEAKEMPVVMMSPVVKLREGPDFAFGCRWALMQYHEWTDRRRFMDMDDETVRKYFREWVEKRLCPWYVEEQYLHENNRALRRTPRAKTANEGLQSAP